LKNLGVSDGMIAAYNAEGADLEKFHATFKKWRQDYDTVNSEAAKTEHEFMEQTIKAIIDSREKQIDAYEEAVNAEAEANSNLISKISDNVARLRELREKEETEKAISENLSKQAYLGMDTSGGNALELLRLQEENE
jgi:septal ring factor EnvC (AmiA/AmiB activator)